MAYEVKVQSTDDASDGRIGFVFHLARRNRFRTERALDAGSRSAPDARGGAIRKLPLVNELTCALAQLRFEATQCRHRLCSAASGHFLESRSYKL